MGVKIKHTDPTLNSFSTDDIVVNVQSGSLFFKSNTKLYKLQGDDQSTIDVIEFSGLSSIIQDTNGNIGIGTNSPAYTLDLGENSSTIRLVSENNGTAIRIGAGGNSNDVTLLRVDGEVSNHDGESDNSQFGFSLKYKGSGSGNANSLAVFADNQSGTAVEALTIFQDGKVGITEPAPSSPLFVRGDIISGGDGSTENGTDQIRIMSNTNGYGAGIGFSDRSVDGSGTVITGGTWANAGQHGSIRFFHTDSHNTTGTGAVFKFDSDQSLAVDIDGNLDCETIDCTAFNNNSDIRLKTNINNIKTPLETISKLKGVTFEWKDNITQKEPGKEYKNLQGTKHGFIAQEVEKILPSVVNTTREYKSLSYVEVVPILVEAIKEQQKQIDELKSKIND